MTSAVQLTQQPPQRVSLLSKVAGRFGVDPAKMMTTLKATAFKVKDAVVTDEQMMALLIVADQYALNPFTKEIYAFPDKGGIVPVVSVDGWARIINEHQQFDGMQFDMPKDGGECTCTMHRKDRGHPTSVTEYMAECKRGTQPWQSHPRRMLRHKAMIQCARMAFGFAGIYDPDEAERITKDMGDADEVRKPVAGIAAVRAATKAAQVIDMETGEAGAPAEALAMPTKTYAQLADAILKATSADTAALTLDEARDTLPADQLADLGNVYAGKWANA